MVTADEVFDYIAQAGPVLPKHIADAFGISTLFASAFLSELSSGGRVRASHLKIGGSPLYYTEEHRDRLVDYRGNLHEKEQKTFELLRGERVLDDSRLELLDRVALRKMQDFAVPLAVDVGGERRIFWKYYLSSDDEASSLITQLVTESEPVSASEPASEPADAAQDTSPRAPIETSASKTVGAPRGSVEEAPVPTAAEPEARTPPEQTSAVEPAVEKAPEPAPRVEPENAEPKPEPATAKPAAKESERQATIASKKPEPVTIKHAPDSSEDLVGDKLGDRVIEYFTERGIGVLYAEVTRKNTTCFGIARVPSAVGELEYYFAAKDKKSITDKDVKEAYAESAILGYPLLYLAKGSIAKSASELVGSKIKGCVIVEI